MEEFYNGFIPLSFDGTGGDIKMTGRFRGTNDKTTLTIYDLLPGGEHEVRIDTFRIGQSTGEHAHKLAEFMARLRRVHLQMMRKDKSPCTSELDELTKELFNIHDSLNMVLDQNTQRDLDWGTIEPQSNVDMQTGGGWGTVEPQTNVLDKRFEEWMEDESDFKTWEESKKKREESLAKAKYQAPVIDAATPRPKKRKAGNVLGHRGTSLSRPPVPDWTKRLNRSTYHDET
ncbi:hypothetical protein LY76DRAFT_590565 [Colletotrichum caudatum]|nr:hypothetical protein LY76DRAFT_590565 [Colletotrichum caudatum]